MLKSMCLNTENASSYPIKEGVLDNKMITILSHHQIIRQSGEYHFGINTKHSSSFEALVSRGFVNIDLGMGVVTVSLCIRA